jgi:tetratricopeptide (TPR) repeat protein
LEVIRQKSGVDSVIYGHYVLDGEAKMLGLSLSLETEDVRGLPMEMSTPIGAFSRFFDRVVLAVLEHLGAVIDDELRTRIAEAPRPGSLEALRQLARAYAGWSRGQNELALAAIESALTLDSALEEAAALQVAIAQGAEDASTVRTAFQRWSDLASKRHAPEVAADRLEMMGHWMLKRGEWEEARGAYERARAIFQRLKHEHGQAQVVNNLANLEILKGKHQTGIQAYRRNLRVFEDGDESASDHIATLMNLSIAHKNLGQQEEALKAIEEALAAARRTKDSLVEGRTLAQRGAIHDDSGHWAQAHADYSQAAHLLQALGFEEEVAMIKTHQGILAKQQGNYDQAERLLLAAETALAHSHLPHEQAVVWANLADLYLSMGTYEQAWDFAERADEVLSRLNSGWQDRVQDIIATLESLPVEVDEEEEIQDPLVQPPSPADDFLNVSSTVTFSPRSGARGDLPVETKKDVPAESAPPSPADDPEEEGSASLF